MNGGVWLCPHRALAEFSAICSWLCSDEKLKMKVKVLKLNSKHSKQTTLTWKWQATTTGLAGSHFMHSSQHNRLTNNFVRTSASAQLKLFASICFKFLYTRIFLCLLA